MRTVTSFAQARALARGRLALVPTMGFLHEGHLSLLERGRGLGDTLAMSLFVNPLQFEDRSDLARYPCDMERDARLAEEAGVDVLFAPPVEEMYPREPRARVVVRELTDRMEGAHRPGHFEGVATVVAKLLAGLRPDVALFGRKDAEQLAVVSRMAADLSFPVEIVGCPLVREPDGLALSSRNVLLRERAPALGLSRGLFAAADLAEAGERDARVLEEAVRREAASLTLEYVELAAQDDVRRLDVLDRPAFLAAAARVDGVRLIDNVFLDPSGGRVVADRGVRLDSPSILYRDAA